MPQDLKPVAQTLDSRGVSQMKICAQGLLHDLTLPSAGHPACLGERIANLGRDA